LVRPPSRNVVVYEGLDRRVRLGSAFRLTITLRFGTWNHQQRAVRRPTGRG
jgi:hypothetical protein